VDMSYRALNGFIDSGKSILDLNGFINLQFYRLWENQTVITKEASSKDI
jgi:hypothetical protein